MTQIIPSLLVLSEEEFKKQIESIKNETKMIQVDLADGEFVPNKTWTFEEPKKAQQYLDIDFELHLMVIDPLKTIKDWEKNPHLKRILVHYESANNIKEVVKKLSLLGKDISVVLDPDTSILVLDPVLNDIQGVMFMGVRPGFQGQNFISDTLRRIKEFKKKKTAHFVEVDGGVSEQTLSEIIKAGADGVCPGSAIFGNENTPAENIQNMQKTIKNLTAKN